MENKETKKGFWATLFAPKQKSSCCCGSQVGEVKEVTSGCGCSETTATENSCCGEAKEKSSCCGLEESSCYCGSNKAASEVKDVLVLGPGCAKCKDAYKVVEKVIKENDLDVSLKKIEDIAEMMSYNIMSTPAVVVDGKVIIKGHIPSEDEVKKALGI